MAQDSVRDESVLNEQLRLRARELAMRLERAAWASGFQEAHPDNCAAKQEKACKRLRLACDCMLAVIEELANNSARLITERDALKEAQQKTLSSSE